MIQWFMEKIKKISYKCWIWFRTEWPRLKPTKCSFNMTSVEILGYIFDKNGVHLSEQRVQENRDISIPTPVSAVRRFVGMVNYFRDFIPSLSPYFQRLTERTKRRNKGENGFEMTE